MNGFRIGEIEGGAVLVCTVCGELAGGEGWFSGFIGGKTLTEVQSLAARHLVVRHIDLPGPGDGAWVQIGERRIPFAWTAEGWGPTDA